jgi:hypothetical protein
MEDDDKVFWKSFGDLENETCGKDGVGAEIEKPIKRDGRTLALKLVDDGHAASPTSDPVGVCKSGTPLEDTVLCRGRLE